MQSHVGNIIIILLILAASVVSVTKSRSADALTGLPSGELNAPVESISIDTRRVVPPTGIDAVATTTTTSVLSEFNKLSIFGSCTVTRTNNQKRCDIVVTYTSPTGVPVIGQPVTIA